MNPCFTFWPKCLDFNNFWIHINHLHFSIKYVSRKVKVIVQNSEYRQVPNLLDLSVTLNLDDTVKTEKYYKDNNPHDYLSYYLSWYSDHSKDNFLYSLAKIVNAFASNKKIPEHRSNELINWLKVVNIPKMLLTEPSIM